MQSIHPRIRLIDDSPTSESWLSEVCRKLKKLSRLIVNEVVQGDWIKTLIVLRNLTNVVTSILNALTVSISF